MKYYKYYNEMTIHEKINFKSYQYKDENLYNKFKELKIHNRVYSKQHNYYKQHLPF